MLGKTLTENDISSNKQGKTRRYTLPRGKVSINFKGKLLSFYKEDPDDTGHIPFLHTYVESIALFKTEKDQYLVFYMLDSPQETANRRQHHVKVLANFAEVETFLDRMRYANKSSFQSIILSDGRTYDS